MEIAKRLNAIIAQLLPFLSQEVRTSPNWTFVTALGLGLGSGLGGLNLGLGLDNDFRIYSWIFVNRRINIVTCQLFI